jgi:hypothetical protein
MAHNVADMDWVANVAASAACDRMLFASKSLDLNTRLHHPKLDEPKEIDPKFKAVWDHYSSSERTWNTFVEIMKPYTGMCATGPTLGRANVDIGPNASSTMDTSSDKTIGEEGSMVQLVRVGCRSGKEHSTGIIEESFCLAALGLAALVMVSEHAANEAYYTD